MLINSISNIFIVVLLYGRDNVLHTSLITTYFQLQLTCFVCDPISIVGRAFRTRSDLLGDLVKLSLYPTNQKSKIAAKYTASDQGNQSSGKMRLSEFSLNIARLAHISIAGLSIKNILF